MATTTSARSVVSFPEAGDLSEAEIAKRSRDGDFTDADRAVLAGLEVERREAWLCAVVGTELRLKAQYRIAWTEATGKAASLFEVVERAASKSRDWRTAAEYIVRLGVSVEHFLKVANDTCGASVKISPVRWLALPAMLEKVAAWVPPDDRTTESQRKRLENEQRAAYGGFTLEELHQRTQRAGI